MLFNDFIMILLLISCCFNNFFTISLVKENAKLRLVLAIPTGVPITLANEANRNSTACCR